MIRLTLAFGALVALAVATTQTFAAGDGSDGKTDKSGPTELPPPAVTTEPAPYRPDGSAVGLTGRSRESFVAGAIRGCTHATQELPEARRQGGEAIAEYCTCYANQMADRVTLNEVYAIADQPARLSEMMGDRIVESAAFCRAQLGRHA
jgi:hypothetical protein